MKNDIIRKLTSLTLMSIMVAGGLTFAIPSALPQAAADPATDGSLTVSTTEFGGQQILEIKVDDSDVRSVSDDHGTLDVSVGGSNVHMVQASTGIWYAYVADTSAAPNTDDADADNPLIGAVLGGTPTGTGGVAQESNSDEIHSLNLDNGPNPATGGSNIGALEDNWPYVQLFDFDGAGDTFNVLYSSDRISVEYNDDLTGSVSVALDRANAPQGAMVHVTISDPRLNLDPTGKDVWLLYPDDDASPKLQEHDTDPPDTGVYAGNRTVADNFNAVDLGSDHGNIDLDTLVVVERDGYEGIKAVNDDAVDLTADPPVTADGDYVVFEETERNSGVFVSFVAADHSPINIADDAFVNAGITVEYAGESASVTVRDESTDIAITSDDFWNSGEPATVTVTAPNLDVNTMDDDDVTITSDLIPTIEIGDPITIDEFSFSTARVAWNTTDAAHYETDGITVLDPAIETGERVSILGLAKTTVTFKDSGSECTPDNTGIVSCSDGDDDGGDVDQTGDLTDTNNDQTIGDGDRIGLNYADATVGGTNMESKLLTIAERAGDTLVFTIDDVDVSAPFHYVHTYAKTGVTFTLNNATEDTPFLTNAELNKANATAKPWPTSLKLTVTMDPDSTFGEGDVIAFDILSFGAIKNTKGETVSVENNAIYRHLVEETDAGGVFEGTLEYAMLNQVNIEDVNTYGGIETQDDELVLIIDDEYSGNDLQISYDDETAHVEISTSTGTVTLDSDRYSTNGSVSVTLTDQDLNVDNDEIERYTLNADGSVARAASDAPLLVFEIDDTEWDNRCGADPALGLPSDFTLEESADEPGTFTASFDIPTTYCVNSDGDTAPVTGKSLQATYYDFRDETGIESTWPDSATIQAITGTVSMDRNVYPVPSDGKSVTVHIEINDPDFNADSDVLDDIEVGAIPTDDEDDRSVRVEITPVSASAPVDISDTAEERTMIGLSATFEETSEDSGIFAHTIEIPRNILGTAEDDWIQQSYILSVTYVDSSDATGETSDTTDSAIFNIGTASLSTDTDEYAIKQKAFITLVDHDSNYDSDTRETIPLTAIEWEGSADADLSGSAFDASPPFLRETESNSGIFLTEITIPEDVDDRGRSEAVELGETVTLTYTDDSPAGAERPGVNDRSVETGFTISRTGATLTLDKDIYSWRDRVTITVVAPDFNIDSLAVESVGDKNPNTVTMRSQLQTMKDISLAETGPNTGIFQGTVDLGGFSYEVAKGVMAQPVSLLEVGNEDGISVTFTYDEDERDLIQSALIRWNVAEVTWLEDSYREGATGTLRVVDIDRNLHPDTPDSIETIVFSDTYRGGINIALTETEPASGVFEGEVIFDVLHSEGNRLQVSEGDIVTASYTDRTLPPPDGEGDKLRITGTTTVGSIVAPLERIVVSNLGVVDALGSAVDSVSVGQQVNIAADLTSAQSRSQDYAYLLQIQNMDGVTVHLSWAASSLAGYGDANVSQSWTPDEAGSYTATVFVWESLTNPTALSPQNSIDITVV